MKRNIVFIILLFVLILPLAAYDFMFLMLGHVGLTQELVFELDQTVVPLNMDSPDILRDPGETPRGKRIGQYSFVTNSTSFTLIITHTPLVHQTNSASSINYRLYMFTSTTTYKSCLSSAADYPNNETDAQKKIVISGNGAEIVNQSVYVNLENYDSQNSLNTETVLGAIDSGTYSSTINFYLEYL